MKYIILIFLISSCSLVETFSPFNDDEIEAAQSIELPPSAYTESGLSCQFACDQSGWLYDNHRWFEGKLICKCVKHDAFLYYYFRADRPIQIQVRRE